MPKRAECLVAYLTDFAPLFISGSLLVARALQAPHYDLKGSLPVDIAFSVLTFDVWAVVNKARGGHYVGQSDAIPEILMVLVVLAHVVIFLLVARLTVDVQSVWAGWSALSSVGYVSIYGLISYERDNRRA